MNLLNDHSNGGIRQNQLNPFEFFLISIPVNTIRRFTFVLKNSNPIDIEIEKFQFSLKNLNIQLDRIKLLNGNETNIKYSTSNISSKFVIPKQHQAIFLLTIYGGNQAEVCNELITIKTHYQVKIISLKLFVFFFKI